MPPGVATFLVLVVAVVVGIALGWIGRGYFGRVSIEVQQQTLLQQLQSEVERLRSGTDALRIDLTAARAEKAGAEAMAVRVPELEANVDRLQRQLAEVGESRGAAQARAEQVPGLEGSLREARTTLTGLQDAHRAAKEELSKTAALLQEEKRAHEDDRVALRGEQGETAALRKEVTDHLTTIAALRQRSEVIPGLEAELAACRSRITTVEDAIASERGEKTELRVKLDEAVSRIEDQRALLDKLETRFKEASHALAAEALKSNNQAFLDLARTAMAEFQQGAKTDLETRQRAIEQSMTPVKEALGRFDVAVQAMEKERLEAYAVLKEQVVALKEGQTQLNTQTAGLVKALRAPTSRGRWGEYQLRRVVELAGMVENCDFIEQAHLPTEESRLRPDVIVHLPGAKTTVVDAKVPLTAYLDALEAEDEAVRKACTREHARQVKTHIMQLGSKAYWDELQSSPDFVVMYVPMESAFAAALQEDPGLIDYAVGCSVIPCGPMTLLTHLKAAAYGWRQERIAANAEQISDLGKQLYERVRVLAEHLADVGKHLGKATEAYNSAVGSFEHRLVIAARQFKELGAATGGELPELESVRLTPRMVQLPEGSGAAATGEQQSVEEDVAPVGSTSTS